MAGEFVPDRSPFSVSPDGKRIAFVLRQADPASNSYCQGLYVESLESDAPPQLVDAGGEYIKYVFDDFRGLVFPTGSPAVITPAWSPDGRWIAYRKRLNDSTQIWLVAVDGSEAFAVTHEPFDVDDVAWSSDGRLIFSGSPALEAERTAIAREALSGYHFDWRVVPMGGPRPYPRSPVIRHYYSLEPWKASIRDAQLDEQILIDSESDPRRPKGAEQVAYSAAGHMAWSTGSALYVRLVPSTVSAPFECTADSCHGRIVGLGWTPDGTHIWYLRREGWGESGLGLYLWHPSSAEPTRILSTMDVLGNCTPTRSYLICLRETSISPRHFVRIDWADGAVRRLLDVNPEFEGLQTGSVRRLTWQDSDHLAGYGDLVLPPGHRAGQKHPLVIVQYRTRGFLRGAVGDLYPIQALAAHGMAVLSLEGPPSYAQTRVRLGKLPPTTNVARVDVEGWSDRRHILASLLDGLSSAIATGDIDPDKIGISGTSEGAVSTWFAVINAPEKFKAASIGSCCFDPKTLMAVAGEAFQKHLRQIGYPSYLDNKPEFWRGISVARNAEAIRTPMLIQIPDEEFASSLEAFTSLKEAGKDADMYVFPGEHHYIWQPAHRRMIYARNLQWFCAHLGCVKE